MYPLASFGSGSTSTTSIRESGCKAVYSGVDIYSGKAIALKRLRLANHTRRHVQKEIFNTFLYRNTEGVVGLHEIGYWCEHNTIPPCRLQDRRPGFPQEEFIFVAMPLAEDTFESFDSQA